MHVICKYHNFLCEALGHPQNVVYEGMGSWNQAIMDTEGNHIFFKGTKYFLLI